VSGSGRALGAAGTADNVRVRSRTGGRDARAVRRGRGGGGRGIGARAGCAAGRRRAGIVVISETTVSDSSATKHASAKCPLNTVVLGGGADITGGDAGVRLTGDGPQKNHWVAAARELSAGYAGSWSLRSWAVCAPQPKGYVIVSAQKYVATSGTITATCPQGKKVLGVGGLAWGGDGHAVLDTVRPTNGLSLGLTGVYVEVFTDAPPQSEPINLAGVAICATPGIGLELVYASSSTSSNAYRTVSVGCPPGTDVHGMGASINGGKGSVHLDGVTPFSLGAYAVAREEPTGYWGTWNLDVFAICAM
jgi:hypothetical protein